MGSKYRINYKQYNDKFGYEYQTNWFVIAIVKFALIRMKYEIVDFSYRSSIN